MYDEPNVFYEMQATAYCDGTTTATGKRVREGMCASKREWFGKVALVYERNSDGSVGDFIGAYEIEDTGGQPIRHGKVIDIYMKSRNACFEFGRKNVLVKVIGGDG